MILSLLAAGTYGCAGERSLENLGEAEQQLAGDGGSSSVTSAVSAVSAVGAGGGSGEGGEGGGVPKDDAVGHWLFDDCSAASADLLDSSPTSATATRSAGVECVPGIDGLAVGFDNKKDVVSVPDQAAFTFGSSLSVAAWVKPTTVAGSQAIVNKQANGQLTFAIEINVGEVSFSVTLANDSVVTSKAPIKANAWTHVAGVYDGSFLFLFVNGKQVGQIAAAGALKNVSAPIHIGNNAKQKVFSGAIDRVFLNDQPLSSFQVAQLACIRRPGTLVATPPSAGPVAPGTTVTYDVALTNNDVGACSANDYLADVSSVPANISAFFSPSFVFGVGPGDTAHFPLLVTGGEEADPGAHTIPFNVFNFSNFAGPVSGQVTYSLSEPTGCFVRTNRELFIRDLSVVEDPIRTSPNGPAGDPRSGVWTFARLMEDMAPTPAAASAMVEQVFTSWLTDQTVNGHVVPARPEMQNLVLGSWPRKLDGSLDLTKAPLRLLGIVNRIDVRNLDEGHAGEGRFVFGVLDPSGFQTQFTLILEYKLPAATEADVLEWANLWHGLGSHPFPSEAYNAALQAITTKFAGRGAAPGRVNGSALGQLRTNEIALQKPWELREFTLSAADGFLRPATVKLTPDNLFNGTPTLADYVNQNEAAILAEKHAVPDVFQGVSFQGGSSFNDLTGWFAPGIVNNEARHKFSLNTCNGCHGSDETGTPFLHVNPRDPGQVAQLSGFMTGITVFDPFSGQPRSFNDLGRRNQDLKQLVCSAPAPKLGIQAESQGPSSDFIRHGIGRVH